MRISDWSSDVCSSDLKALRGLETGLCGFDDYQPLEGASRAAIEAELVRPTPDRLLVAVQALREGFTVAEVQNFTHYDPWFLERFVEIVAAERGVIENGLPNDAAGLRRLKAMRSEEHTSELQSLMRNSYAVFCLKKKK